MQKVLITLVLSRTGSVVCFRNKPKVSHYNTNNLKNSKQTEITVFSEECFFDITILKFRNWNRNSEFDIQIVCFKYNKMLIWVYQFKETNFQI